MAKLKDWEKIFESIFANDVFFAQLSNEEDVNMWDSAAGKIFAFDMWDKTPGKIFESDWSKDAGRAHMKSELLKSERKNDKSYDNGFVIDDYVRMCEKVQRAERVIRNVYETGFDMMETLTRKDAAREMEDSFLPFFDTDAWYERTLSEIGEEAQTAEKILFSGNEYRQRKFFPAESYIVDAFSESGAEHLTSFGGRVRDRGMIEKILQSVRWEGVRGSGNVKIEVTNTNNISSQMDIDDVSDMLTDKLCEIMAKSADGFYE